MKHIILIILLLCCATAGADEGITPAFYFNEEPYIQVIKYKDGQWIYSYRKLTAEEKELIKKEIGRQ